MLSSYLAGFSAQIFPALAILLGGFSLAPALDAFIYLLPTLAVGLALAVRLYQIRFTTNVDEVHTLRD